VRRAPGAGRASSRRTATARLLERNGMTIDDLDYIEVNEAFASVIRL
jgi:acetyl-CoA acetyltransferase